MRSHGRRLLIRRLGILLLLAGLYYGGRWAWDALHPGSPARWKAHMAAGEAALGRKWGSSIVRPIKDLRLAEAQFRAALTEARKFRRGDTRLAESYYALGLVHQFYADDIYYIQSFYSVVQPDSLPHLGYTYDRLVHRAEAERAYLAALKVYRQSSNPGNPDQLEIWVSLSNYYHWNRNNSVKCVEILQQALQIAERAYGKEDERLVPLLDEIAVRCSHNVVPRQNDRAYTCYARIIRILERAHGPCTGKILPYLRIEGELATLHKDISTANVAVRKFLITQERVAGATLVSARNLHDFADQIDQLGQPVDVKPLFLRALEIYEAKKDPAAGYTVLRLCDTYRLLGKFAEEEALMLRHIAWLKRSFKRGTMLYEAYSTLAAFYHRRGETARERAALAEQKRLYPAGAP